MLMPFVDSGHSIAGSRSVTDGGGRSMVDRVVEYFAPQWGLRRSMCREALAISRRTAKYAAAKTDRLTGAWSPMNTNVNDVIGASSMVVRGRVRQLVRDFPYFSRAVNMLTDYTVGEGITYQARVRGPDGNIDTKTNQKIEDALARWMDQADIAGKLHFYEMMQLAKRQDVESGEFVLVKTRSKDRSRFLPFCLQMFEADWLTGMQIRTQSADTDVEQGIEYNKNTGQVIAYHFTDPDGWGKTKRIPASDVIHGFQTLRPGQLRGISPLTPGVLVAHSLHDYMEAEIDAAKMAAKWLAMIKTPSPLARQTAVGGYTDSTTDKKIESMENAIIEYLRPGEEVEIAKNPRPGDSFTPFVRLVLHMMAITANVPYELISGEYTGLNYAVTRVVRNDFAHVLRPIQMRHVRQFGMPIIREVLDEAAMTGRLRLPGYYNDPLRYQRCEWQPPGMASPDPLREGKANSDGVKNRLVSPQEIARRRGRDLEDVYREIAEAEKLADQYGITIEETTSTALANNPAAVDEQADTSTTTGGGKKSEETP